MPAGLGTSEHASTPGFSSRRSACDRCRGQKLGCLRERCDPSGRCDRCAKADAQCVTTPVYHMRHYTIRDHAQSSNNNNAAANSSAADPSTATPSHKRRRRQHPHHNRQDKSELELRVQTTTSTSCGNTNANTTPAPPPTPGVFTPAFATFEWPSLDAFGKSGPGVAGATTSHVSSPEWCPMMDVVATTSSAQPAHSHRGPTPQPPTTLTTPGWDSSGLTLDDYLGGDLLASGAGAGTGAEAHPQGLPWPPHPVHEGDILEPSSLGDLNSWVLSLPPSCISIEKTRSRQTEELARINLELATQLRCMVQSPPDGTLKRLIVSDRERPPVSAGATSPTAPLLGDILNSTRRYLDVLGAIADGRPLSNPSTFDFHHLLATGASAPPLATTSSISMGASSRKTCGATTTAISPDTRSMSSSSSRSSTSSASSSSSSSPRPVAFTPPSSVSPGPKSRPDASTTLLALICYVHILRLHVATFAHIRQYLELVADSDHRKMTPISGFCGFEQCALQSGNLQTTMFIQMVTNTFERMESLLGLPREFHIGRRDADGTGGLLSGQGFVEVARSMLRKENAGRPEEGQGGIKSLRKSIKKAKRLLRDRIAP